MLLGVVATNSMLSVAVGPSVVVALMVDWPALVADIEKLASPEAFVTTEDGVTLPRVAAKLTDCPTTGVLFCDQRKVTF